MRNNFKYIFVLIVLSSLFACFACEDFLTQPEPNVISAENAYSSVSGVNSIVANLYSRMRVEQDFSYTGSIYGAGLNNGADQDMARWDEVINNHATQWQFTGVDQNSQYRQYYDYSFIRDLNIHISKLNSATAEANISEKNLKYFKAEARFLRAYTYFLMVFRMGGVPIIEEPYQYTTTPIELAKPRDTEERVYDYVVNELDSIMDNLNVGTSSAMLKTRATKGAALALKCRAMLYAGTLAFNDDQSIAKGLKLTSGATGLPKAKANIYLQKCLDAYNALEAMGIYSLYNSNSNKSDNYYELFTKDNSELIFYKDYDGVNFLNSYTERNIPRSQRTTTTTGAMLNPLLNLADCYEIVSSKSVVPLDAYVGDEHIEKITDLTSTYSYNIYNTADEIFNGRDPRFKGTILYPGSSFKGKTLDLQAGLAVKTPGGYTFEHVDIIDNVNGATNLYNGIRKTGVDGPHRLGGFCSHTGFQVRKFLDSNAGAEAAGKSKIPYVVFRYGEVLLNAAEAAWYLGQKDLALQLINRIRNRAGGSAFELTSAELDLNRIMNERRVELVLEDHRFDDVKRWRIADEIWDGDRNTPSAVTTALWPYKIYDPGQPDDGKWLYRRLIVEHRGADANLANPIRFGLDMYYSLYPKNDGNPLIEKNPHQ
jgi:starch-binding outer membrane protein, SusD/RagB family